MNKSELNNKLAELYFIPKATELGFVNGLRQELLLIDDWSRLMDLAVDNHLNICHITNANEEYFSVYATANDRKYFEDYSEHESPEDATRYAIAMDLVKLAEDK